MLFSPIRKAPRRGASTHHHADRQERAYLWPGALQPSARRLELPLALIAIDGLVGQKQPRDGGLSEHGGMG